MNNVEHSIEEKKNLIIEAGKNLLDAGLIARTWGNISCRIDSGTFLITPSGRNYRTLTPEEIVTVKISDLSYEGGIKPSSEKGIHAKVYALYPEMEFVIHTHQMYASAISVTGLSSLPLDEPYGTLKESIQIAKYALPGTKKLMRHVTSALKVTTSQAIIMQNHGALCFGKHYEEAFKTAELLEQVSKEYIYRQYQKKSGDSDRDDYKISHYAIATQLGTASKYSKSHESQLIDTSSEPFDPSQMAYIDQKYRFLLKSPEALALSQYGIKLKPMLDDYAQIAGHNVAFIQNQGAYCYGEDPSETEAVLMVTNKNAKAYIVASLFEHVKPIHPIESLLMRVVYKTKYSKYSKKSNHVSSL